MHTDLKRDRCGDLSLQKTIGTSSFSSLFLERENENENVDAKSHHLSDKIGNTQAFTLEAPTWARPAKGEARLEPVCESVGRQASVDLTTKSSFRFGRSPNSDIQLIHATSSRKHAIIFHHANGSCYIVDCGSAHGTFVNGKRVTAPAGGIVVPQKVKRGSIIRFGGPGSPSFVLKSFSTKLDDRSAGSLDMGVLVRRNTRLNALGISSNQQYSNTTETISLALNVMRKRSFDSLATSETLDDDCDDMMCKRMRCSSPLPSPEAPLRLVSPELSVVFASKPRKVTFSPEPPTSFYPAVDTFDDEDVPPTTTREIDSI